MKRVLRRLARALADAAPDVLAPEVRLPEPAEFKVLHLQPGDMLVYQTPLVLSAKAIARLRAELGRVIGIEPGRILVLEEGGRLNALRIAKDAER